MVFTSKSMLDYHHPRTDTVLWSLACNPQFEDKPGARDTLLKDIRGVTHRSVSGPCSPDWHHSNVLAAVKKYLKEKQFDSVDPDGRTGDPVGMDRHGPLGWTIKRKSEIAHFGIPSQAIQGTREQMTCSGKGMMRASTIFFCERCQWHYPGIIRYDEVVLRRPARIVPLSACYIERCGLFFGGSSVLFR